MSTSFITPRDLLEIEPENPARLTVREIRRRFGVSACVAIQCRQLAMRSPQVLEAQWRRLAADKAQRTRLNRERGRVPA